MMVINRSLTKPALWNVIKVVEGRESEWGDRVGWGYGVEGKGGWRGGRYGEIWRDWSRLGLCIVLMMVINRQLTKPARWSAFWGDWDEKRDRMIEWGWWRVLAIPLHSLSEHLS